MRAALLALTLLAPGCASAVSVVRAHRHGPYLGTRFDADIAAQLLDKPVPALACALDLPLSFALDTALLPYTLPAWLLHRAHVRDLEEQWAREDAAQ